MSGSLYNCIHYGVFRAYCWIYQKLKHIERNLPQIESGCNGNLFLAENLYSPDDLDSRGSNLQLPVRNGTCLQRIKKFGLLWICCTQVSLYLSYLLVHLVHIS